MRATLLLASLWLVLAFARPAAAQRAQPGDTEVFLINYQAQASDPAAATLLSIFPGFGAGHFYADSVNTGLVAAGGEALGIGLFLLGPAAGEPGDVSRDLLMVLGAVLYAAFKVFDVGYAPIAAREFNRDLAMQLRIPLIGGPRAVGIGDLPTPRKKPEPAPEPEGFQY